MADIRVGGTIIPVGMAGDWLSSYTDSARHSSKSPSAHPAYDHLDTGSAPDELNGGDLLAPTLLNAAPSVSAFYRLQAMSAPLEVALSRCPVDPLASVAEDTIREVVGNLYAVLDEDHKSHPAHGVGGTTLSKILHRKRPAFLCLNDQFVWSCYVENGPIPRVRSRSWANYMVELALAMRNDLIEQSEEVQALREHVRGEGISDLRILDILAWTSKGMSPSA